MAEEHKTEDSEDMKFWKELTEDTKRVIAQTEKKLKFLEGILESAEAKYEDVKYVWENMINEQGKRILTETEKEEKEK
ncbi:MAG: hypothetical protein ACTSQE_14760 [Candidatus Heimdallarchaeaceae archaeon]